MWKIILGAILATAGGGIGQLIERCLMARTLRVAISAEIQSVLTTNQQGEHHITIPRHNPLRVGTLAGILDDVAYHFKTTRAELVKKLFA